VRKVAFWAVLGALALALAGCGESKEKGGDTDAESEPAQAACTASPISETKLPQGFPSIENVTYTKQPTDGPTEIVEGYFTGSLEDAHDEFKNELGTGSFKVTDDELDEHDSEVNWEGTGRSGQVALREECGESDKIYVQITNRPA
jgi:hypothetical protein